MEKEQQTQSTVSQEQSQSESVDQQSYSYSHKLLNILLGAFVAAVVIVAALLCQARVQVMERDFLLEQQKLGQSWVENALESLGRWREKAIETINYVSQAEMFRLFIHDCEEACGSKIDLLQSQEVRLDEAHPLHSFSEQLGYLADLLADIADRRGWQAVHIVTRGQQNLISYPKDAQVDAAKKSLISHAQTKQRILLGTIYKQEEQLVLDIVVPMYAVQSVGENVIEGFMLVTLPMQNVLADILAPRHLPDPNFVPLVLTKSPDGYTVASMQDEKITLTPSEVQLNDKKVPFAKRISCRNINQAEYSQGGHVHNTGWYVLLEQDAALVEAKIAAKARNIYALGVFGTLFIALILAIIVGSWIARTRAREGQKCISGLVHAIECALDGADAKFKYLQGRSQKVARFSGRLGRIMKLSGEALENIQLAARLSQVGKIFVPREIMVKRGLLTEDERRQVQLAPYHAYNVLKGVLPRRVARIVYQMGGKVVDDPVTGANHELTTKEMLLEARVLLVANDFCAMVSQRGTRPPLPMAEARKKLEQRALYDRDVIAAVNTLSDAQLAEILELDLNPSNSAS